MNRRNLKTFHPMWIFLPLFLITIMPMGIAAAEFDRIAKLSNNKTHYLRNGFFQERYDHWRRSVDDICRGSSQAEIINFPHGKSGKALHIRHGGSGHIQFAQIVSVPGPDLIFTASFQANSREGMMRAFSGSGVVQIGLQYFDEASNKLGDAILVNYVKSPFADTPLN
jgi:hypothetical protein